MNVCTIPRCRATGLRRLRLFCVLLAVGLLGLGTREAAATTAVIHFQTGAVKEDQLVTIELFDKDAPVTVANFKALVEKKFYNGLAIHRIIPETLVQMGDPLSRKNDRSRTGTGGPGYTLPAEIGHKNVRGAVAMAALPPRHQPGALLQREPVLYPTAPTTRIGQGLHRLWSGHQRPGVSGFAQPTRARHQRLSARTGDHPHH